MTTESERVGRPDTAPRAVWSAPEPGHYILKSDARTIGHVVEAPDGSFLSFNEAATSIARHNTLESAQAYVQHPDATAGRRRLFASLGRFVAATGVSLAFSIAAIAATTIVTIAATLMSR